MGYHTYESYALQGFCANQAPNDSTAYNIGDISFISASAVNGRIYIPRTGTIRAVYVTWVNTVDSTAENTTISIRKNDTSDSTGSYVGSFANAASPQTFDANLAVAKGDFIFLRVTTPAWVTNPTGVYVNFVVEVQC